MARWEEGAARGKVTMWIMTAAAAAAGLAVTTALMLPGPQATGQSGAQSSSFNSDNCEETVPRTSGQAAFPTAEGFGRFAKGGRGGMVYLVTSLQDRGPGTLRECAEASGPRTCVFRVSGTIVVDDWIKVMQPYLTIAGQTSPGGIAIRIRNSLNSPMLVQTHDVVIRHIRLRPGASAKASDNVDTIQISGGAHDVILDHLSTSWPTDEGINIVGSGDVSFPCGETRDISVQWSILSEGLNDANRGPHSRGSYFGYGARNVSFHHNLIASNVRRNPLVNLRGNFDIINNVIYNSQQYNGEFYTRFGALAINMIGNVAVVGPSSQKTNQLYLAAYFRDYPAPFDIYVRDNVDIHRPANNGDQRLVMPSRDWQYIRAAPVFPVSLSPAAITGPGQAYRDILAFGGATRPVRDTADKRLLNDMAVCKGQILNAPSQVGGWPVLSGGAAPLDQDKDGMADNWESAHGLSPTDGRDGAQIASDGYSNLEHYLSSLAGDDIVQRAPSAMLPDPTCGFAIKDVGPLPEISIKAQPSQLAAAGTTTLSWTGQNIKSCKLLGLGVPANGSRQVTAARTTTYQIACIGPQGGDAIDTVVVRVGP